jgi:hypothetical protein
MTWACHHTDVGWEGVSPTFYLGSPWTSILPVSTSWIAGIIGTSHCAQKDIFNHNGSCTWIRNLSWRLDMLKRKTKSHNFSLRSYCPEVTCLLLVVLVVQIIPAVFLINTAGPRFSSLSGGYPLTSWRTRWGCNLPSSCTLPFGWTASQRPCDCHDQCVRLTGLTSGFSWCILSWRMQEFTIASFYVIYSLFYVLMADSFFLFLQCWE